MKCRYHVANFLQNPLNKCSIACLFGWDTGVFCEHSIWFICYIGPCYDGTRLYCVIIWVNCHLPSDSHGTGLLNVVLWHHMVSRGLGQHWVSLKQMAEILQVTFLSGFYRKEIFVWTKISIPYVPMGPMYNNRVVSRARDGWIPPKLATCPPNFGNSGDRCPNIWQNVIKHLYWMPPLQWTEPAFSEILRGKSPLKSETWIQPCNNSPSVWLYSLYLDQ